MREEERRRERGRWKRIGKEKKIFFFKQKTEYERLRSLVGSEMCIRARPVALSPQR